MSAASGRKQVRWNLYPPLESVLRLLLRAYFRLFHRVKILGPENIPASGPLIIAPNHQSNYDGMLLGFSFLRPFHPMVESAYCKAPVIGWLLSTVGAIPVDGPYDRKAYRRVLEILKRGEAAAIFPEGHRSRDGRLQKLQGGAARAGLTLGADILPVSILGAFEAWPRSRRFPRLFHPIVVQYHPLIHCPRVPRNELKTSIEKICRELEAVLRPPLEAWLRERNPES